MIGPWVTPEDSLYSPFNFSCFMVSAHMRVFVTGTATRRQAAVNIDYAAEE